MKFKFFKLVLLEKRANRLASKAKISDNDNMNQDEKQNKIDNKRKKSPPKLQENKFEEEEDHTKKKVKGNEKHENSKDQIPESLLSTNINQSKRITKNITKKRKPTPKRKIEYIFIMLSSHRNEEPEEAPQNTTDDNYEDDSDDNLIIQQDSDQEDANNETDLIPDGPIDILKSPIEHSKYYSKLNIEYHKNLSKASVMKRDHGRSVNFCMNRLTIKGITI